MGCSAGTQPQWSENYLWEGSGAARAQQWEGEEGGVQGSFQKNIKNSISMKGLVKKWTFFIKNFMTNYILAYPH